MQNEEEYVSTLKVADFDSNSTEAVHKNYLEYGINLMCTQLPNAIDGLKDVQRRIVYYSNEHTELVGMNAFVGKVSNYHTGGDSSIEGATIRLAQPFMVGHPLLYIDGESGKYYEPGAAAASRYLEVKISDFSRDIYFKGINPKTVPMGRTGTFKGEGEPIYLIPKIPMSLVLGNYTVGFAFKSDVNMIDFPQVCDLVMLRADSYRNHETLDMHKVAKLLVPNFPIRNLIRNRAELIKAYSEGDFEHKVDIEGWVEINGYEIVLRAVPYGNTFNKCVDEFRKILRDKKSWLHDVIESVNKYDAEVANCTIVVKKGNNPFEVFERIKGLLSFNSNKRPYLNYTRNGKITHMTPVELLNAWYRERYISIASGLKYELNRLVDERMMAMAIMVVIDDADEVVSLIRSAANDDDAVQKVRARWEQLTHRQAKWLVRQQFSVLTKQAKKDTIQRLEDIKLAIAKTHENFGKIDSAIYADADILKKKYGSISETRYSDEFIGYVQYGHWGITHFFDDDELPDLLVAKYWPANIRKSIHYYDNKYPVRYYVRNGVAKPLTTVSKQICCEDIICCPALKEMHTLVISSDGGTNVINRVGIPDTGDYTLCPVTKTFYGIHFNGDITVESTSSYTTRKSVCSGRKTDLIYGLPKFTKDAIVFHMNSAEPNVLRADRILIDENTLGNLGTVPTGKTQILGVWPFKSDFVMLNVPEDCIKSRLMEFLKITNVSKLFGNNTRCVLNLTKNSDGRKFVRHSDIRTMYLLNL